MSERLNNDFLFTPVSVYDVKTILDSMKNSAPGCDEIPIVIYKEYYGHLGAIITKTCSDSLTLGTFPEKLSITKVKCFFKSGNKSLIKNYRPISILRSFSKINEKNC